MTLSQQFHNVEEMEMTTAAGHLSAHGQHLHLHHHHHHHSHAHAHHHVGHAPEPAPAHLHVGYSGAYGTQIKYEPVDSISSTDSQCTVVGGGTGEFATGPNTHQHQQLPSNTSPYDGDFFESPDHLSSARLNDVIQSVSQGAGGSAGNANNDPHANSSSGDEPSSPDAKTPQEVLRGTDRRQIRGRPNNADRKRPYPCKVCPSKFGSKMELEEHQNSHTGQKPFECEVCKSRFNRRSTLWNHKRIHSDAKPFVCTVCHMQFKWKNSLKCHKEMHVRKNETSVAVDNDIRQLTYATAAKKRLLEMEGTDTQRSVNSMTIFSAASTSQAGMEPPKAERGTRKKSRVIKKELCEENVLLDEGGHLVQVDQNGLLENSLLTVNVSQHTGSLPRDMNGLPMDLQLDPHANLDFMNNSQLLMQAICNGEMDAPLHQLDLRSGHPNHFGMEDVAPKMLSGGLLDLKDVGAVSPLDPRCLREQERFQSLISPISGSSTSPLTIPFFKPILNVELPHLNASDSDHSRHPQALPTIGHFATDYGTHDPLAGHFILTGHNTAPSSTSSSSTPSSLSNGGHHGHLHGGDLGYQQSLDHGVLLGSHNTDYFDYMMPSGASGYGGSELQLNGLATDHLEHSPHSHSRMMLYHANPVEHHPGCLSSQNAVHR